MHFEYLDLWVPPVFRQRELALPFIQGRVNSVFERMLGSVCCLVRTDFCDFLVVNPSSGMCLLLKNDTSNEKH